MCCDELIGAHMTIEFLDAMRPLFDCLTDGVCITDSDGRLLYANEAAGRLLGPAAEEAVKTAICGPLCGGIVGASCGTDAADCPLRVRRGPANAMTFAGKHAASGRDLRVRCLRVPLHIAERRFMIIEDNSAEAELGRQREDWRQMLAHDVRAPLAIAMGTLRLLEDMGVGHALSHDDVELIGNGVRNCRRMGGLIDAYLETERLVEGSMPVHSAAVDAARMIGEIIDEQKSAFGARGLTLTGGAPKGLTARADPELLRRALTNLIGNALKFTPSGGRVVVDASGGDGSVLFRVSDSGPGISPHDLPRIFDRFYQGASGTNGGRRHGLGLGLTFCRAALRAMGGEVAVESEEGKGSIFTLRLPQDSPAGGSP